MRGAARSGIAQKVHHAYTESSRTSDTLVHATSENLKIWEKVPITCDKYNHQNIIQGSFKSFITRTVRVTRSGSVACDAMSHETGQTIQCGATQRNVRDQSRARWGTFGQNSVASSVLRPPGGAVIWNFDYGKGCDLHYAVKISTPWYPCPQLIRQDCLTFHRERAHTLFAAKNSEDAII